MIDAEIQALEKAPELAGFALSAPELLEPLDAFGQAGSYDRARMAQLYGGRRVTVVRGWRRTAERFQSVTLLSPYPDATLRALHEGTMMIRWTEPLASPERLLIAR